MMDGKIIKLAIAIVILAVQGCYYDAENYLYPESVCNSKGYFAAEVQPLINTKCKSCHTASSAGGGIILETYDQIKTNSAKVLSTMNHAANVSAMPKGEPIMPACEIKKVQLWIDGGMLNN